MRVKTIFSFINYRHYLRSYYETKKSKTRYFTYRYFAKKADVKSPVFLKQVISGERNLTRPMIQKFSNALELNKKESRYFKNLTLFNQATTAEEKQEYYSVMVSMKDYVVQHQLTTDQYAYFDDWYNCVIRELICLGDYQDDFEKLGNDLIPKVTKSKVKKSVELLKRLKLIKKEKNGRYQQTQQSVTSGSDFISLSRREYNSKIIELSQVANKSLPPDIRNISNMTMGISREGYNVILTELEAFKERIASIVNQDKGSDQVYQLSLSLFPGSQKVNGEGSASNGEVKK